MMNPILLTSCCGSVGGAAAYTGSLTHSALMGYNPFKSFSTAGLLHSMTYVSSVSHSLRLGRILTQKMGLKESPMTWFLQGVVSDTIAGSVATVAFLPIHGKPTGFIKSTAILAASGGARNLTASLVKQHISQTKTLGPRELFLAGWAGGLAAGITRGVLGREGFKGTMIKGSTLALAVSCNFLAQHLTAKEIMKRK